MSRPKTTSAKTVSRKGRKAAPPAPPAADPSAPVDLAAKRQQRKQLDAAITSELRSNGKGRRRTSKTVITPAADPGGPVHGVTTREALAAGKPEETAATPPPPPAQVEVGPAERVVLTADDLKPFLAIAPTKEKSRPYLNGVYLHKPNAEELRLVATDGQRMLVATFEHKEPLSWGEAGIVLPAEQLGRIAKYIGSSDEPVAIAYGANWKNVTIEVACASFTINPIDGKWPDYGRVLEQVGDVFAAEREPVDTAVINPKFLKAAGAIGTMYQAEGVFCYVGRDNGPLAFTFAKVPGVLLVVMPMASGGAVGLSSSVAKLVGEKGMSGTLAALRAHETRNRKAGNAEAADRFAARIAEILKGVSAQIEHKPAEGAAASVH